MSRQMPPRKLLPFDWSIRGHSGILAIDAIIIESTLGGGDLTHLGRRVVGEERGGDGGGSRKYLIRIYCVL